MYVMLCTPVWIRVRQAFIMKIHKIFSYNLIFICFYSNNNGGGGHFVFTLNTTEPRTQETLKSC